MFLMISQIIYFYGNFIKYTPISLTSLLFFDTISSVPYDKFFAEYFGPVQFTLVPCYVVSEYRFPGCVKNK